MRAFLGIPIPDSVVRALYASTAAFRQALPDIRWVKESNYHITVLFLGEIDSNEVRRIQGKIDEIDVGGGSNAMLGGIGQFPPKGAPKVVYIGLQKGADRCLEVYKQVCDTFPEYAERRRYMPHITLGRAKRGRRNRQIDTTITLPEDNFRLEEIVLYKSTLSSTGAKYERVHTWVL